MTPTTDDGTAALIIAAFSKVEQVVLDFTLILVAFGIASVLVIVALLYWERRDRRKVARQRAAVEARIEGGALR